MGHTFGSASLVNMQQQAWQQQQQQMQQQMQQQQQRTQREMERLQQQMQQQQQQRTQREMERLQREGFERGRQLARQRAARNPALGVQQFNDVQAGWMEPLGGRAVRGPAPGLARLFRLGMTLAVLVVAVGLVLLVFKPSGPEWLVHVVHALDRLVHTFRSMMS